MKKTGFLQLIAIFIISMACTDDNTIFSESGTRIVGSGVIVSEERSLGTFTKVDSETSIEISIEQGTEQAVTVSADDNVIGRVNTKVSGNTLKVDLANGSYNDITVSVIITIPMLEGLNNTGSGSIMASGFESVAAISVANTGSGHIGLSGSGEALILSNAGSGVYNGFDFTVKSCSVMNAGSGSCEIFCTEELNGSNSGSGTIFYKGQPSVAITNTGSGSVVDVN